jgi:CO/xanthine dehydrogenase FAD-binding subunit
VKAPAFDYARPKDLAEALKLLAEGGRPAAGTQSLGPMLNLRLAHPPLLVDIRFIEELKMASEEIESVTLGACITHAEIEDRRVPDPTGGLMASVAASIAYRAVRNRGTIGGSLCHNDPASEMPLVANLVGATLIARSASGERAIAADKFFKGNFETALHPNELLVEIRVPIPPKGHGWSFQEVSQRKGDFALVAAGAVLALDGGVCRHVRLGFRNVGATTFRLPAVEARIEGQPPGAALFAAAAEAAMTAVDPPSDLHADEAYRRDLVKVLAERVLATAAVRARQ